MNDQQINQPKLWLPNDIYQNMVIEADKRKPLETGGIFMGYIANSQEVVVTDMIGPGKNAIHTKNSFIPDQDYQLEKIKNIYDKSNRDKIYLGDWHTHPNNSTDLSLKDKKTLTRIATTPESLNLHPLMVILGGQPKEWTMNTVQFISGKIYMLFFVECRYKQLPYTLF